jgi:hypothetical protein
MNSNHCGKLSLALLIMCGVLGGLLVGSSASQEDKRPNEPLENGRFQMVETRRGTRIFDTRSGRSWLEQLDKTVAAQKGRAAEYVWDEQSSPWANAPKKAGVVPKKALGPELGIPAEVFTPP